MTTINVDNTKRRNGANSMNYARSDTGITTEPDSFYRIHEHVCRKDKAAETACGRKTRREKRQLALFAYDVKIQSTFADLMNEQLRESRTWEEANGMKRGPKNCQILTGDNTNRNEMFSLA